MKDRSFKGFTSKLGIPHVCVESPAKTRRFFFREEGDVERYVKNFDRYVDFHYLSIFGSIEYLRGGRT